MNKKINKLKKIMYILHIVKPFNWKKEIICLKYGKIDTTYIQPKKQQKPKKKTIKNKL